MPRLILIVLGLCCFCLQPALADFYDGNKLVSDMREFEKAERRDPDTKYDSSAHYVGYVVGVHDTISNNLCWSGNITVRQVTTVVAKYLNEHPEEWSRPAHQLVARALRNSFPCRTPTK